MKKLILVLSLFFIFNSCEKNCNEPDIYYYYSECNGTPYLISVNYLLPDNQAIRCDSSAVVQVLVRSNDCSQFVPIDTIY